jgi:hypothetical protein
MTPVMDTLIKGEPDYVVVEVPAGVIDDRERLLLVDYATKIAVAQVEMEPME